MSAWNQIDAINEQPVKIQVAGTSAFAMRDLPVMGIPVLVRKHYSKMIKIFASISAITDCSKNENICHRHGFCIASLKMCICETGYAGDGMSCHGKV